MLRGDLTVGLPSTRRHRLALFARARSRADPTNSRWEDTSGIPVRARQAKTRIAGLGGAQLFLTPAQASRPHATAAFEQQRRSNPLTPWHWVGLALDQRQHHRTLAPAGHERQKRASRVEITARKRTLPLRPTIGRLMRLLPWCDLSRRSRQVDVGVGANGGLFASEPYP